MTSFLMDDSCIKLFTNFIHLTRSLLLQEDRRVYIALKARVHVKVEKLKQDEGEYNGMTQSSLAV